MVNDDSRVTSGICGICPDWFPSSLGADLRATLQALRHTCLPVILCVDRRLSQGQGVELPAKQACSRLVEAALVVWQRGYGHQKGEMACH